jgi:16S rRNA (guanine(966)-N(2))-methyltransferase RsmD
MRSARTQVRIVSGSLKGRRLICTVTDDLRPTPQMVREAYFSILGDAIPNRPFYDIFAGTGALGLEAISRGAKSATFLEHDFRLAGAIDHYLADFGVRAKGHVVRVDVYRWVERWQPHAQEPANVFVSPPFADLQNRLPEFMQFIAWLQDKLPLGSVLTVQAEEGFPEGDLPGSGWERRQYGRNLLLIWLKIPSA